MGFSNFNKALLKLSEAVDYIKTNLAKNEIKSNLVIYKKLISSLIFLISSKPTLQHPPIISGDSASHFLIIELSKYFSPYQSLSLLL